MMMTVIIIIIIIIMKKCSEETKTLHAGCSKAEPKNFAQLEMVTTFTYKPSLVRIGNNNNNNNSEISFQCFDTVGWTTGRVSGL